MIFLLTNGNLAYKLIEFNRSLQPSSKIILGIDPGSLFMGYAIVKVMGNRLQVAEMDTLKMSARKDGYARLQMIYEKIAALIQTHKPDCFAIEAPFFGKNVQSMLKLGRAQGVAIAAALQQDLNVFEYAPRKVKQAITGNGNADKEQVWKMLRQLLSLKEAAPKNYDASDALAVAICHYFEEKRPIKSSGKKLKGWEAFIKASPERVSKK